MKDIIKSITEIRKALTKPAQGIQSQAKNKYGITLDIDDPNRAKEVMDVISEVGLPDEHVHNNPDLKSIVISTDKDFYSKHNRETHTIVLSEQVFTEDFRKAHPFHRISHVPTLTELLVHEIGHSVDQGRRDKGNTDFESAFDWVEAGFSEKDKQLRKNGYESALTAFINVPKEKLTTIDDEERGRIAEKIKAEKFYQKPDKHMKISWYGLTAPREDFAESYANYVLNSANFKKIEPARYAFLKEKLFRGKEYPDYSLKKSVESIRKMLVKDSDLESPYGFIPGTDDYIEDKQKLTDKVKDLKDRLSKKEK